jgi:mRNA-degrading endonuclease YafQ of YafQ-DinJ toxin-antitoxin module
MIEFVWDKGFKRSYKKKILKNASLKLKFEDPFNTKLKTHKLSGTLKDFWAFSVDYDCRVIYKFLKAIDIGSHDEVY